jgi:hypothetical protein
LAADPVIICDFGGSKLAEHVGLWRAIWLYTIATQFLLALFGMMLLYTP